MKIEKWFSLEGKNALVIGGSRGLGNGIALALAYAGADVVITGRKRAACLETAEDLKKKTGRNVYAIEGDISTVEGTEQLINRVDACVGHIDILVNSAGINIRKPALEYTEADWDRVQNVQLKGVFFASRAAAEHMVEQKIKGRIINIASINAKIIARPNIVSYVAAKSGVMQMTKSLAVEWAEYGITVNAIAPGFFRTELTQELFDQSDIQKSILGHIPMKRFGDPGEDLGAMAVYYASQASEYTTGQMICIDGGYTLV